jgi:hypothetical protein
LALVASDPERAVRLGDEAEHAIDSSKSSLDDYGVDLVRVRAAAGLWDIAEESAGRIRSIPARDGRCFACGYPVGALQGRFATGSDERGTFGVHLHDGCLAEIQYARATGKPMDAVQQDRHFGPVPDHDGEASRPALSGRGRPAQRLTDRSNHHEQRDGTGERGEHHHT